MGCTVCTEPQCLYKGDLYLTFTLLIWNDESLQGHKLITLKNELHSIQTTLYISTRARICLENLMERDRLKDLGVDGRITLKLTLKKWVRIA
jgi:hypothetical protein